MITIKTQIDISFAIWLIKFLIQKLMSLFTKWLKKQKSIDSQNLCINIRKSSLILFLEFTIAEVYFTKIPSNDKIFAKFIKWSFDICNIP